jgi:hypothetical protein
VFIPHSLAGRIAVTLAEAQDLLAVPVELIVAYVPAHWRTLYGENSVPVQVLNDIARMLRIPCYE